MFDKAIIDTDRFMDLSMSSKALYFLMGMEADDEGFVSYKKVMRIHGGNDDDIKVLAMKNFIIPFKSGVVVITDWNNNNYLDKNRIRFTEYQNEKKMLTLTSQGKYELNNGLTSIEEKSIEEKKEKTIKGRFAPPSLKKVKNYCEERGNGIDPQGFRDFYESKGWFVGKNKMKDWKAAVRTWEKRNGFVKEDEEKAVPKNIAVEIDGINGARSHVILVEPEELDKFIEENKGLNPTIK